MDDSDGSVDQIGFDFSKPVVVNGGLPAKYVHGLKIEAADLTGLEYLAQLVGLKPDIPEGMVSVSMTAPGQFRWTATFGEEKKEFWDGEKEAAAWIVEQEQRWRIVWKERLFKPSRMIFVGGKDPMTCQIRTYLAHEPTGVSWVAYRQPVKKMLVNAGYSKSGRLYHGSYSTPVAPGEGDSFDALTQRKEFSQVWRK